MQQKETLFHEGEIISLDDFGISGLANRRIIELVQTGKMGRVSVMADRSIGKEDTEALSRSGVKLDIHLDVDGPDDGIEKIEGGFFRRISIFVAGYLSGKYQAEAVMEKWESQIENFQKIFKRNIDFCLNSKVLKKFCRFGLQIGPAKTIFVSKIQVF